MKFSVGGLTGQPIHNYLLPEWLAKKEADLSAFKLMMTSSISTGLMAAILMLYFMSIQRVLKKVC